MYRVHIFTLQAVFLFCLKGADLVYGARCAGKEFDPEDAFCCGAEIHRKTNGDGYLWRCCEGANKPFSNIEVCCGSEIRKPSPSLDCCKNEFFNNSTHKCCEKSGKILNRKGRRSCCGRRTYNRNTQICCGNDIYNKEPNIDCCGNRSYNNRTHDCIGKLRVVLKGSSICGSQGFPGAPENYKCCERGWIDIRQGSICCYRNQIFPESNTHYCDGYTVLENHEIICGKEKININNMVCCNNVSHVRKYDNNGCCGTQLIDASKKGCCNNKVTYRLGKRKCCGEKVIGKAHQCCGGSTPYDNTTSKCYRGDVVPLEDSYCGRKPMNVEDLCCENIKLYKNAKKTKKCCGRRAIKASCKCCSRGRKKCCRTKTKRKQQRLSCRTQNWYTISDLMDGRTCIKQAFFVKKLKKKGFRQWKQLFGRNEKVSWKLDKSCDFIKTKRFVIVETVNGEYSPIKLKSNKWDLRRIKQECKQFYTPTS